MKFALPVSDPQEVLPLIQNGADEFYCGILEDSWAERYGTGDSISRRQGDANFRSLAALKEAVQLAVAFQKPVWLTLNARVTHPMVSYLISLAEAFASFGGCGVILRDFSLLDALQDEHLPLRYCASLLCLTVNEYQVEYLHSMNVSRVVFPRFLSPYEMSHIACCTPAHIFMEYEAMIMDDGCPMIDGLCRSLHSVAYSPALEKEPVTAVIRSCDCSCEAHHLCMNLPRQLHPCAACRMRFFDKSGITIGKFGGRGTPLDLRLKKLRFMNFARHTKNEAEIKDAYCASFGHDCECYYGNEGEI